MSTKRSKFERVLEYFQQAGLIEAESCLTAATRVLADRKRAPQKHRATKATKANAAAKQHANATEETVNA